MLNKFKSFTYGFILFHMLWFFGTYAINERLIPSPVIVYANMDFEFWSGMIHHIRHSLWRLLLAMSISMILGLVLGTLMAQSKVIGKVLNPFIYFTYPIPKMAFLPIIMLLLRLGDPTIITMIILIIVFQIIINVRDGISNIPEENYQTLRVLGASKWQLFKEITFPAALSQIFSSARVALGTAIAILFITENNGTRYGMGHFIMNAQVRINYVDMFSGIVVLSIISFLLFLVIDVLSAIFMKWD